MQSERLATVEEAVKNIRDDVLEIKSDVKSLLAFKWKLLGASALVAFLTASFIEIAKAFG